jgi:plastocyanin
VHKEGGATQSTQSRRRHRLRAVARGTRSGRMALAAALPLASLSLAVALSVAGCGSQPTTQHHALHVVTARQVAFQPSVVNAAPGDTIEWRNRDLVPHTVSARKSEWDSGNLPPDSNWRFVPTATGTFAYVCRYHTTMAGTLAVVRAP